MVIDGRPGSTGIRFKPGYEPVKYQFSASSSGPWHSGMQTNDKYRRDSLDGGTTWGTPYQFRGTDGRNGSNGSDANVTFENIKKALQKAASTQQTFITADSAGAPNIYGGKIYGGEIYAGESEASNYAKMSSDGLELYKYGVKYPKFVANVSDEGEQISIIMGAGNNETGVNRFHINKLTRATEIYYEPDHGKHVGFVLHDDGVIEPLGTLHTTAVLA